LAKENHPKEQIKVTDKRIFTPEGEIREEFRGQINPTDQPAQRAKPAEPPPAEPKPHAEVKPQPKAAEPKASESHADRRAGAQGDRRRHTMADEAANPGTPFTNFLEPLVAQAYMSLGMLPNPYQQQTKPDIAAARQMIDILTLLQQKTAGNLTPEEEDFLSTYVGELKLAFVKITKTIT
jgi:hypothetical protein